MVECQDFRFLFHQMPEGSLSLPLCVQMVHLMGNNICDWAQ